MASQIPITEVPSNWMHPDLRRQLTERSKTYADTRLERIDRYRIAAETRSEAVRRRLDSKRARLEQLESEVAALRGEVESMEARGSSLRQLALSVSNQAFYQRSVGDGARVPSPQRPYGTGAGQSGGVLSIATAKAALPDISSSIGSPCGYEGGDPATTSRTVVGGTADPPLCALEAYFMHHASLCLAAPAFGTGGGNDAESITAFLRRFAPLFTWDAEQCCVPPPLLFDEPCLMEMEEDSPPCRNPGCAYWHYDELGHLKRALEHVANCADAACTRDFRLCGVSKLFTTLRAFVRASTAIDQLCCGVAYSLNRVIALGWHKLILRHHHHHQATAGRHAPGLAGATGWPAPVAQAVARGGPTNLPVEAIACEEERDAWEVAVSAVQHGSTPADVFTAAPTALSWRCMMRMLGTDRERRLWLAEKGCGVFPTSPHLQVAYLLALMEDGSGVAPAACAEACLASARLLSTQSIAAAFTQPETTYSAVAARYVGFMVAVCAVRTARREPSVAVELLTEVLGSPAASIPPAAASGEGVRNGFGGGYALLPIAHQNLTLLLIALQRTGRLSGAEWLPLAAISDAPLVLSTDFPADPQEASVVRLNGQLTLLNACQRDGMAPSLLDPLKAATQLSLVRTFSQSVEYVEQIVRKAAPHSEEGQAALWLAYARSLCLVDGFPSAPKVTTELLLASAGQASCLLVLLMSWHLRSHPGVASSDMTALAKQAVAGLLERHGLPQEGTLFCAGAATIPVGVSRVEWIACHVLAAEVASPEPAAQQQSLLRTPLSLILGSGDDADPALLFLMAELRAAAALGSTESLRDALERCLDFLATAHRQWWSALDTWAEEHAVGLGHWVSLCIYRIIPFLLGERSGELTLPWRTALLEVASRLRVLHPLLREEVPSTALEGGG